MRTSVFWLLMAVLSFPALADKKSADNYISAKNLKLYKDNLTEGQIALLKGNDKIAFKIAVPDKGVTFVSDPYYVAYPDPKNGEEVMWNHLTRFRGNIARRAVISISYLPDKSSTRWEAIEEYEFAHYKDSGIYERMFRRVMNPSRNKGELLLYHHYFNQANNEQWQYLPGTRRVRTAPLLKFDVPSAPDGVKIIDMDNMFSGSMEKFDWDIVGKSDIYLPKTELADDLLKDTQEYSFEKFPLFFLQSVYVIEAILKADEKHIYSHRLYYIDPNTWQIIWSEHRDANNQLAAVSMASYDYYPSYKATIQSSQFTYNLKSHSYLFESYQKYEFLPMNAIPDSYFTVSQMRRGGCKR